MIIHHFNRGKLGDPPEGAHQGTYQLHSLLLNKNLNSEDKLALLFFSQKIIPEIKKNPINAFQFPMGHSYFLGISFLLNELANHYKGLKPLLLFGPAHELFILQTYLVNTFGFTPSEDKTSLVSQGKSPLLPISQESLKRKFIDAIPPFEHLFLLQPQSFLQFQGGKKTPLRTQVLQSLLPLKKRLTFLFNSLNPATSPENSSLEEIFRFYYANSQESKTLEVIPFNPPSHDRGDLQFKPIRFQLPGQYEKIEKITVELLKTYLPPALHYENFFQEYLFPLIFSPQKVLSGLIQLFENGGIDPFLRVNCHRLITLLRPLNREIIQTISLKILNCDTTTLVFVKSPHILASLRELNHPRLHFFNPKTEQDVHEIKVRIEQNRVGMLILPDSEIQKFPPLPIRRFLMADLPLNVPEYLTRMVTLFSCPLQKGGEIFYFESGDYLFSRLGSHFFNPQSGLGALKIEEIMTLYQKGKNEKFAEELLVDLKNTLPGEKKNDFNLFNLKLQVLLEKYSQNKIH